jgi:SAM-dependent methyltransferase
MIRLGARLIRRLRWRRFAWSASTDRAFHDAVFAALPHDPFSPGYPGSITIRRFADLASPHVLPDTTVLDAGCGPGEITCELARRHPRTSFLGVDHSSGALATARAHQQRLGLPNVSFHLADVEAFVPDRPVSVVMMFDSFHHLTAPAAFVERVRAFTSRFLLIEPIGDPLGRWRESADFDWLALELDQIRTRIEESLHIRPEPRGAAAADTQPTGEAVEHRYTMDDFERFFDGFSLDVRGTASGLLTYPPDPVRGSRWRDHFGELAYQSFKVLDEQLLDRNADLWARHWVIYATPGTGSPRRSPGPRPSSGGGPATVGPYDVAYDTYNGPFSAPAEATVSASMQVHNLGCSRWESAGSEPVFVSYRWLTRDGVDLGIEGHRTPLARPVLPGDTATLFLTVTTPPRAGRYLLGIELVREGVTWFSRAGQPVLRVPFRVTRRRRAPGVAKSSDSRG